MPQSLEVNPPISPRRSEYPLRQKWGLSVRLDVRFRLLVLIAGYDLPGQVQGPIGIGA